MAKSGKSASKQRKGRKQEPKKAAPKVTVEVNERQIAGGSLATTGDRGADTITRIADFLQANGTIVLGLIAIGLIMAIVAIALSFLGDQKEAEIRTEIRIAASKEKPDEVIEEFNKLGEKVEANDEYLPYYYYSYALALYQANERDEDSKEADKAANRKKINELIDAYDAAATPTADPAREQRLKMLKSIASWMNSYRTALDEDPRLLRLEDSKWEPTKKAFVAKSAATFTLGSADSDASVVRDGDALELVGGGSKIQRFEFDRDGQISDGIAVNISEAESVNDVCMALYAAAQDVSGVQVALPRKKSNALVFASSEHDDLKIQKLDVHPAKIARAGSDKQVLVTFAGTGATLPYDGESVEIGAMNGENGAYKTAKIFEFDPAGDGVSDPSYIAVSYTAEAATRAGIAQAFLAAAQGAGEIPGFSFSASGETGVTISYTGQGAITVTDSPYPFDATVRDGSDALNALTTRVALETSQGTFYIDLYDLPQIRNTINTLVTLIGREGYNETSPSKLIRPGITAAEEFLYKGLNLTVFGEMVKLVDLPSDDEDADAEDEEKDPDAKPERSMKRPYFAILEEEAPSTDALFVDLVNEAGTICLYADLSQPKRRGTQFAVNLIDNTRLNGVFPVIGYVSDADGRSTSEVISKVAKLNTSDKIYRAWIVRKHDREYIPDVVMLEGSNTLGLPQPWYEEPIELEQPTLEKPSEPKIIGDDERPQIAISIEGRGDVLVELFEDETPNTVANIIHLIETNRYKGSDFHRVEGADGAGGGSGLRIIQGGRESGKEGFDWTIKNEYNAETYDKTGTNRNLTGTIAMARTNDVDSAGNQFFINLKDMPVWDQEANPYCVFGAVVENLWVLYNVRAEDKIKDIWVVQKRDHAYIPTVKKEGEQEYGLAAELPEEEAAPDDSGDGETPSEESSESTPAGDAGTKPEESAPAGE